MERISDIDCPQKLQAIEMAKTAGIELTYSQLMSYINFRRLKDPEVCSLSDHQLLHIFLDRDQKYIFEQTFKNIERFI